MLLATFPTLKPCTKIEKTTTAAIADLYEANQMSNSTMVSHNLTLAKEELAL